MNAPGAGAASTDAGSAPSWRTLVVFALFAPALVVAVGSPAVTLATIAGFVLGKSVRVFPVERLRGAVESTRGLLAGVAVGPAATEFESFEERVE